MSPGVAGGEEVTPRVEAGALCSGRAPGRAAGGPREGNRSPAPHSPAHAGPAFSSCGSLLSSSHSLPPGPFVSFADGCFPSQVVCVFSARSSEIKGRPLAGPEVWVSLCPSLFSRNMGDLGRPGLSRLPVACPGPQDRGRWVLVVP